MSAPISADKTRTLESGEILFLEGDEGHEMYIVKRGQIQILKREGAKMVQLATLGPGSVIGELSLLDSQPRSATARALNHSELVTIDQDHLSQTYSKIPSWLSSLIKILVSRLRETNQKKHLKDLIESFPAVLYYLNRHPQDTAIPYHNMAESLYNLYGISEVDLNKVLKLLKLFNFIEISQGEDLSKTVFITQKESLEHYDQYLKHKLQDQTHPWADLKEDDLLMFQIFIDTAKKRGTKNKDQLQFTHNNLDQEMEQQGIPQSFLSDQRIKRYTDLKLIQQDEKQIETQHGHHNHNVYLIDPDKLNEVIRFQTRLDYFNTPLEDYFLM